MSKLETSGLFGNDEEMIRRYGKKQHETRKARINARIPVGQALLDLGGKQKSPLVIVIRAPKRVKTCGNMWMKRGLLHIRWSNLGFKEASTLFDLLKIDKESKKKILKGLQAYEGQKHYKKEVIKC